MFQFPIKQDYTHRAISHCIYSFQIDSKTTFLQSDGFFRDEYKNKDNDVDESSNGFTTRAELTNKNGVFHANFIPRIPNFKIFSTGKYSNFGIYLKS